jgi:hypothetical protein
LPRSYKRLPPEYFQPSLSALANFTKESKMDFEEEIERKDKLIHDQQKHIKRLSEELARAKKQVRL